MEYDKELGMFHFKGGESETIRQYLWCLITDLSWRGRITFAWMILWNKPPQDVEKWLQDNRRKA